MEEKNELVIKIIDDVKNMDYQSLVILQAGIKMLAAYQKIDKKPAA